MVIDYLSKAFSETRKPEIMKFTPDKFFSDENEFLSYLTHELINPVFSYGFELFKTDLWKFAKAVVGKSYLKEPTPQGFKKLAKAIDKMIEGAWQFLVIRKRYQLDHSALNTPYTNNPFRQCIEHRFSNENKKHSYESPFVGILNALSKEETRNFAIVIEHFFTETGVIEWKRKIQKWLEYANTEESIISDDWDENPLDTFEKLYKLVEAVYLVNDFVELQWDRPPNYNLFRSEESVLKINPTGICGYNPLNELNWAFGIYNVSTLKLQFKEWFECATHQERVWDKGEPGDLITLHDHILTLIEAGWLLTKFDEIPAEWLDPNEFEYFENPIHEEDEFIHHLTKEECTNLSRTLSFTYKCTSADCYRYDLNEILNAALQTKEVPFEDNFNFLRKLNRIFEVLYLINLEYCKKFVPKAKK